MENPSKDFIPTSAVSFIESSHGRVRREQRGIGKKDLTEAKKYGKCTPGVPYKNGVPTSKYTYNGIVYITNDLTGQEITSYALPVELKPVLITNATKKQHSIATSKIHQDFSYWKSNTVIVVDTSG
eukprot:5201170-Ditylum_brightwellii.AAC.1